MKTYLVLFYATLLLLTVSACAGSNPSDDVRVKCPACGYQFDIETDGN